MVIAVRIKARITLPCEMRWNEVDWLTYQHRK